MLKQWAVRCICALLLVSTLPIKPAASASNGEKITLTPHMVTNEIGLGDAAMLVDEQILAGDPRAKAGGKPKTTWMPGWNKSVYPAFATIDLQREYNLSSIYLFDTNDKASFNVYALVNNEWVQLFSDPLNTYETWRGHDVNVTTRHLRIERTSPSANAAELVVYGTATGKSGKPLGFDPLADKVHVSPDMVINETGLGNAGMLVDEQDIANDPRSYKGGKPLTTWMPGWSLTAYPARATINLQKPYALSSIYLFDTNDVGNMNVSAYVNGQWTPLFADPLNTYETWRGYSMNITTQFIRIERTSPSANVGELVFYGTETDGTVLNQEDVVTPVLVELPAQPEEPAEPVHAEDSVRIQLNESMVINETLAPGEAVNMFDEQDMIGDVRNNKLGQQPVTRWFPTFNRIYYPASIILDLQAEYDLTDMYLFDSHGFGSVTVSTGEPFRWQEAFTDTLRTYNEWSHHPLDRRTRFIQIFVSEPSNFNEIVLYGKKVKDVTVELPKPYTGPALVKQPTMDSFIGMNAFIDDPMDVLEAVGFIREYHNWEWNENGYNIFPNNRYAFSRSYSYWNFDRYYQTLSSKGITVSPVIQRSLEWLVDGNRDLLENKPILPGTNPADPAAYKVHAQFLYHVAARYGQVPQTLDPTVYRQGETVLSGLNTLRYVEDWNEQDKWWKGRSGYFSPYEYAAMASADYDGHLGTLGPGFGVKTADPNFKLVMGGIATLDVNYMKMMKFWSDYNRNGSFPADVINLHIYAGDGAQQQSYRALSPEEYGLKEKIEPFVQYRNEHLPDKEIWITEFGYDTHPDSPQAAPAIGSFSNEEVQGQWLIRSYLALAAAGVDRTAMYMVRDTWSESPGQFATSGLTKDKWKGWERKPSWYYVYTLKHTLAGLHFDKEISSGHTDVSIYSFKHEQNGRHVYAVWSPTASEHTVNDYKLTLPDYAEKATLTELTVGSTTGTKTELPIENGQVTITVGERPVFIAIQ